VPLSPPVTVTFTSKLALPPPGLTVWLAGDGISEKVARAADDEEALSRAALSTGSTAVLAAALLGTVPLATMKLHTRSELVVVAATKSP
jgi:hypothetical protein